MIVLGVDPGSVHTGYGVVLCNGQKFSLVACGLIRLSSKQSIPDRIKIIYDELGAIIAEYNPQRLALETAYVNRNPQSALKLGQVRGAIVALTMNKGLELHEYAPREVKYVLTGKGSAGKEQVSYMARHFLNIQEPIKPYDVTDALGIALCDLLCDDKGLSPRRGSGSRKSARGGWEDFVRTNPEMIV